MSKTVLVTGATGKQGGATLHHLLGKGFALRALTRKPESDAARALAADGVEIVQGDLDAAASLEKALAGAWGVYGVQNTWEAGVEKEEEQGKRLATLARKAGVEHYVYASVGSANRRTSIPHFDNKARVEETVRSLGFPSTVIIRPVFFMENLVSPWFLNGNALTAAMKPETQLQMIAVDDIGVFGAMAFTKAEALRGREIDIAGDARTMLEAAAILGRALGRPLQFVAVPIEEVRKNSEDLALMLEWFDRVGYDVDITGLEREFGVRMTPLEAWAQAHAKAMA